MCMNSSASVAAVPVIPESLSYCLKKFWMVIVATVWFSSRISTPSLASMAWWSPSEYLRPEGLVEVVDEVRVDVVVEVLDAQSFFYLLDPTLGRGDLALLLVHLVVLALLEARDYGREAVVDVGGALGHPGDDERGARLVDEDGINLVHDGEVELALHELFCGGSDVVPQVVEAELGVGAVGEVGFVGYFALLKVHGLLY